MDEMQKWYFEVWNEPNIDFWNGIPRQRSYFELYDHTARDLSSKADSSSEGRKAIRDHYFWVGIFAKVL